MRMKFQSVGGAYSRDRKSLSMSMPEIKKKTLRYEILMVTFY